MLFFSTKLAERKKKHLLFKKVCLKSPNPFVLKFHTQQEVSLCISNKESLLMGSELFPCKMSEFLNAAIDLRSHRIFNISHFLYPIVYTIISSGLFMSVCIQRKVLKLMSIDQ